MTTQTTQPSGTQTNHELHTSDLKSSSSTVSIAGIEAPECYFYQLSYQICLISQFLPAGISNFRSFRSMHPQKESHIFHCLLNSSFSYLHANMNLHFGQVHSVTFIGVNFWSRSNVKVCCFRSNSNQFLVILIRSSSLASSRFKVATKIA